MTNERLKEKISGWGIQAEFAETKQFLELTIPAEKLVEAAKLLKNDTHTKFDYLICLSGVDYGEEFAAVYHLESTEFRHSIVLKVKTSDRKNPNFDTVCNIWQTAEWHEREIFDLFGIKFNNHPDLRRLLLPDDWEGYPLRKDYKDDINMIVR